MAIHTEIEPSLWASAVWSVLAYGYKSCDYSYEDFQKELKEVSKHYKHWWEGEDK